MAMFLTLLLPLLLLLGPWGLRGPWTVPWSPWGAPWGAVGADAAVVPPSWADPRHNPCAAQPGGWQLILWPADGRCYRIFRRGPPCPSSMELTPGVGPGGAPGCRCPPGTALLAAGMPPAKLAGKSPPCYPLMEQGPCPPGHYLAPLPPPSLSEDRVPELRAMCRLPEPCPAGHVFWPRDGRCYPRLTRGPCYRGELLTATPHANPLGVCRCESRGELGRYYFRLTKSCHEHYTPGPCQERGMLFLPGGVCGCSPELPHYHPATGRCYQIDTIGPCPAGHRFTAASKGRAQCQCKGGHVPWTGEEGGEVREVGEVGDEKACYRPWTRGPCPSGQLLSDSSHCVPSPCRPGRLYFPSTGGCYKVGVRGPCPKGQVVLFETAVRPALEGISYRAVCGCTGPNAATRTSSNDITGKAIQDNRCSVNIVGDTEKDVAGVKRSATRTELDCESKSGAIVFNGTCYMLYSQGPCPLGQWLVPQRTGREGRMFSDPNLELWSDPDMRPRSHAKCDCRPGHKPVMVPSASNSSTAVLECQPPTVVLASFLNSRGFLMT